MTGAPADLRYSRDHRWVRLDADAHLVRAGVTDFAQQALGDVVDLTRTPEIVNTNSYGQGWMFDVEDDPSSLSQQLASLMDARAYRDLAGS